MSINTRLSRFIVGAVLTASSVIVFVTVHVHASASYTREELYMHGALIVAGLMLMDPDLVGEAIAAIRAWRGKDAAP